MKKPVILLPWMEENLKLGWTVYDTWTTPPEAERGTDCLSNAVFSFFVAMSSGMPGAISPVPFAPKSETEVTTAIPYDHSDPNRKRKPLNSSFEQALSMLSGGVPNYYEGTLVYTPVQGG